MTENEKKNIEAAINRLTFRLGSLRKRQTDMGVAIGYAEQEAAILLDRWNEAKEVGKKKEKKEEEETK